MKRKSRCPVCRKRPAIIHPVHGVLPCQNCQDSFEKVKVGKTHEFTSSSIKRERVEYAPAMLQPYVNGVLSKEFIEKHGTSKLAGVTKQDIKNAKYVYKDLPRSHRLADGKI